MSSGGTLNFLWQAPGRPVYVMDNHLGALWCWLRELAPNERYSLLHLDYHWDATDWSVADERLRELDGVSLDEYTAVRFDGRNEPLVHWANYMAPLPVLRPGLVEASLGAWQDEDLFKQSPMAADRRVSATPAQTLLSHLADLTFSSRLVLNLDMDLFFLDVAARRHIQAFTDDFLTALLNHLRSLIKPSTIVTLALSPECCGGWKVAERLCSTVCAGLGIPCPEWLP